jgi:hypothetical protein
MRIELATMTVVDGVARPATQTTRTVFRILRQACPMNTERGLRCNAGGAIQVTLNDVQPNRYVIVADIGGLISDSIAGQDATLLTRVCEPTSVESMCVDALRGLGFAPGGKVGRAHLFFFAQARK